MFPIGVISFFSALLTIGDARVTFPFSEVIQTHDLKSYNEGPTRMYKAVFNCDEGCKVYTDTSSDQHAIAQNDIVIANFTDLVGDTSMALEGYELPAGVNYTVRAYIDYDDFVFYAVRNSSPNYNSPVFAPEGTISVDDTSRCITVLSSYDAMLFDGFDGIFPDQSGYPKIFATGFDTLDDLYGGTTCRPVYEARSQYFAENSAPTIFAPIITVDFGYAGNHSVSLTPSDGKNPPKSAISSVVYMSPGYVGCPFESDQMYNVHVSSISDSFIMITDSLDISEGFYSVASNEEVKFTVNEDILNFNSVGSPILAQFSQRQWHYADGAYKVNLSWQRKTTFSGWFIQIDLGRTGEPEPTTTTGTVPTTTTTQQTTTSSGSALSILVAIVTVLFVASEK